MSDVYYQKENFNGIYDFRCRFHDGFIIESHIHEYSEILYCQNGNCDILINGKMLHLNEGEFAFIPPNYLHQYNLVDVNVICAVFSNDFIPLFFKFGKGKKLIMKNFKSEEIKCIFEELPKINPNNAILITSYLNLICNKVIEQGDFEKGTSSNSELYQRVISYLAENYNKDISLKQIAKTFGYNQKYLSYTMHSLTGIHFSDFIALYRVECARKLLANSEYSVAEISMRCGFSAINTFNRQFKKLTSKTPTQYRKLYSINNN